MTAKKGPELSDNILIHENLLKFFNSHPEAFLLIDGEGIINYANKSASDLFGYSPAELRNSGMKKIFSDLTLSDKKLFLNKIFDDRSTEKKNLTATMKRKDHSKFLAQIVYNELPANNGRLISCMFREAGNQEELIDKLRAEKDAAVELSEIKANYIAQLSHEIRTPVNIVLNFTDLVREVLDTETQQSLKEEFAIIRNAGKRIIRTVDLVLNMSEIQSGKFKLNKTKFDLYDEIILRIVEDFKLLAKERNLELTVSNNLKNPIITADDYSVFQCLMNIVDNSFKYTEKGKIEIKLDRDTRGRICVNVSDTGIGMSEEYQKDLFKPFHQEDTGFAGKIKGNGLGLSLVKKYCELNDIIIEIKSKKGVGTKTKLIFPEQ